MVTLDQLNSAIVLGEAYFIELLNERITGLSSGAYTTMTRKITCLNRLIRAIGWDIADSLIDVTTDAIYRILLCEISDYTGIGVVANPNVYIPGQTVIPSPASLLILDKDQTNLLEDGEGSGNWYLPFLNYGDVPFLPNVKPVELTLNGVGIPLQPNYNFVPMRLYGFTSNDAQTIKLSVI